VAGVGPVPAHDRRRARQLAAGADIDRGIGHAHSIDRRYSVLVSVVAGVGGRQRTALARARGAAVRLNSGRQARRRAGNAGLLTLVIGRRRTLPDVPAAVVRLTLDHLIDRVIDPTIDRLITAGPRIGPLFGQRIHIGVQVAAGDRLLDQIVVMACAFLLAAAGGVIVVGVILLQPRRALRGTLKGRHARREHHRLAGRITLQGGIAITGNARPAATLARISIDRLLQERPAGAVAAIDLLIEQLAGEIVDGIGGR